MDFDLSDEHRLIQRTVRDFAQGEGAPVAEELTRVDSSVAITVCAHTSLGTQPIYLFGSEQQKQEWLPQLCSGQKLGAFGLTEPEAGSDAGNTQNPPQLQE